MSTPHSCGHAVMFATRKVAEQTLSNYKPATAAADFEVIECEKCHWFLIVKKA